MTDNTIDQTRHRESTPSHEEVREAVYRHTPAGTKEVADVIGQSRPSTYHRLQHLEERDLVWSKKIGPTLVWIDARVLDREVPPE